MNLLARVLIILITLGFEAHGLYDRGMVYEFDNIEPSTKLTWTPCFDAFNCSKLEVPLDHSNRTLGTTSVAFIKLAGKNATVESPSIVIIPGGPGGSGIDLLLTYQNIIGQMFGEQYNFVSFDPRGVNNSGLHLDCFSGDTKARSAFYQLHRTGVTNISSTSLEEQYYSSSIYGDWCNHAVKYNSPQSYYVTTPAVAHDLLAFTEAEAKMAGKRPSTAKLWCYSVSYGTVIGSTFASMFPDRVGRMILDGVLNADQYYSNYWTDNVDQMDEAMETFSTFCHSAGPENCSLWGPTPTNITSRLDGIIREIQNRPVPLSRVGGSNLPTMVTYSDLKTLFLNSIYAPLASFPSMADTLYQAERGNVSALAGLFDRSNSIADARLAITCTDSYRRNKLSTIEEFKTWVEYTTSKSKYFGDIYPMLLEGRQDSFHHSISVSYEHRLWWVGGHLHRTKSLIKLDADETRGLNKPTSFPILFASNTIDPITPLLSARKMSSRFAGSVILMQEAVGAYSWDVPIDFSIRSSTRGDQTVTLDIFRHTSRAQSYCLTLHARDSTLLS